MSKEEINNELCRDDILLTMSDEVGELFGAMCKAQADIVGAVADSENPFFNSKYADLTAVINATKKPLAENDLCVIQTSKGEGVIITTLGHKSGQWIRGELELLPVPAKNGTITPQAVGSAITYARRYALAAITGCAQIDSDAEEAMAREAAKNQLELALQRHAATIDTIKTAMAENKLDVAVEAWAEMSQDEKASIWIAPTKAKAMDVEPPFTTDERAIFRSNEWNTASKEYFGER